MILINSTVVRIHRAGSIYQVRFFQESPNPRDKVTFWEDNPIGLYDARDEGWDIGVVRVSPMVKYAREVHCTQKGRVRLLNGSIWNLDAINEALDFYDQLIRV